MRKIISTLLLAFALLSAYGQYKMRPVEELIDREHPAWPVIQKWIDSARNAVEVLPVDTVKAKEVLYRSQSNTGSAM